MSTYKFYDTATKPEEVYKSLSKDILNLTIKPGQVITEQEICEKYNISRTPSRDVLQKLKNDGLVISIPYKANYVTLLSIETIKQFIYMRRVLEIAVIKDFIENLDDKQIHKLESNLDSQASLLQSDFTAEEFYRLDGEFHAIWFSATNKLKVWEQIQKLQVHYTRFRMLDIVVIKDFQSIFNDHQKLVESIKNRDIENIERHITDHLNSGFARLGDKIHTEYANYFIHE
ncbi:transcriptional regulator [Gracilibacillus boraciitolerans JCM 21714]|uniref:Transcriptional regulator n=1 Tax=Gracilibacillus boraciitolerans JCM 21714 TaxID=1298598 RepID=W4VMR7_9BACI|nr:GntR family transcriptional regulator [Gracilibacillus boraciitolerans]GAE94477.1 transcriptional regulator [Gracilibacillus boraciitolerans JCM 21714]